MKIMQSHQKLSLKS
jgi:hypothetical protein